MLTVKQAGIKYHFLSLWYDSTWDWNPVSQTIDEHFTHLANEKKKETNVSKQRRGFIEFSQQCPSLEMPYRMNKASKWFFFECPLLWLFPGATRWSRLVKVSPDVLRCDGNAFILIYPFISVSLAGCLSPCIYILYQSKVFSHLQNFLFLILKVLFLMK